jgi:hypothetical protein
MHVRTRFQVDTEADISLHCSTYRLISMKPLLPLIAEKVVVFDGVLQPPPGMEGKALAVAKLLILPDMVLDVVRVR